MADPVCVGMLVSGIGIKLQGALETACMVGSELACSGQPRLQNTSEQTISHQGVSANGRSNTSGP